ncbi:MAG: hypothetical protein HYR49_07435 [Gammaproteobacteria bacterium]|nr:hypothetical protein [Gammaproteobacteria bacterium]
MPADTPVSVRALAVLLAMYPALVQPAPAVWKDREVSFTYHGFTTRYSCDGLKYKVKTILKALGARPGYQVRATGCNIGGGVAPSPRVHIQAAFPELLPGGAADPGAFPASPGTVTLSPRSPRELDAGDCELVEQLRDGLLAKIGAEVIADQAECVPHQHALGRPLLKVELLRAEEG